MEPFKSLSGVAAPLPMINVDTDMIIPKQFLKTIKRTGLGSALFHEMRTRPDGSQNADFVLNKLAYRNAQILVTGANFGCGSSREHAPWALLDFGIRCVIAPSFADIFFNNCFKNGILPIALPQAEIDKLLDDAERGANAVISIDLEKQEIRGPDGGCIKFDVDPFRKQCLLNGWDDVGLTLRHEAKISDFEARRRNNILLLCEAAMSEALLRDLSGGLLTLTLNRPDKLNALSFESFKGLAAAVDFALANKVGCVLLKGAGRSFCAGNDLGDLGGVFNDGDNSKFRSDTVERLASLPMPVIAQVQGHCLTGGLELALAADIIICGEGAKFGDTHGKWDLVPVWGLSQRLPRRIGRAKALEMSFSARQYGGRQAETMGLANICVPDGDLDATVAAFVKDVLANSWRSSRAIKKLLDDTDGMPLKAGLAHEVHRSEGRGPETAERLARMRK